MIPPGLASLFDRMIPESRHKRRADPTGARVMAWVFIGVGAFLVLGAASRLSAQVTSHWWADTAGLVTVSRVVKEKAGPLPGQYDYRAEIAYSFVVSEARFASSNVWPGEDAGTYDDEEEAREFVDRYPQGATVMVHFAPDDPSECALEIGLGFGPIATAFAGFGIIAFGLVLRHVGRERIRQREARRARREAKEMLKDMQDERNE